VCKWGRWHLLRCDVSEVSLALHPCAMQVMVQVRTCSAPCSPAPPLSPCRRGLFTLRLWSLTR
jgi:hypothetical protein